ncbi:MAG: hypothetical protein M2R45_02191 [Verrucomicrobia subdivision 3 bacterium]|nr:hypothetical protein [Limisphaerales bacterium]MCS1413767.1 hypothetical protein [Limisphaerales bacterium]
MKMFMILVVLFVVIGVGCSDGGPQAVAADIDIPALLEQLKSPDADTRLAACVSFSEGLHRAAPAINELIEVCKTDKDAQVREMAVYAIYQMGEKAGKPAVPMIKERWEKERSLRVRSMLFSLWNMLEPETAPTVSNARP